MKTVSDAICIVLSAQALYGILQYAGLLPQTSAFRVSGSYDNPAGFAAVLCSGLPFVMTGLMHKARQTRCLHIAGTGIMIVAIILSRSRSGLMALLAVFALGGLQFVDRKPILKCAMVASLGIALTFALFQKTDSISGRLFIWRNTVQMVSDKLLTAFIAMLIWRYRKNRTKERLAAILSIMSVLVFSLFSYPLMFPFVWFSIIYGSIILFADIKIHTVAHSKYLKLSLCPILIAIGIWGGRKLYERTEAEIIWKSAAHQYNSDKGNLSVYESLYNILGNDRYFLYNYAYTLYQAGDHHKSLEIADRCRLSWADYDVEMLTAANYEKMEMYKDAEAHYRQAGYMCPNRFIPLYCLMCLYEKSRMNMVASKYAEMILAKPVKIPSIEIEHIKQYAANFLEDN